MSVLWYFTQINASIPMMGMEDDLVNKINQISLLKNILEERNLTYPSVPKSRFYIYLYWVQ